MVQGNEVGMYTVYDADGNRIGTQVVEWRKYFRSAQ
jgi:hypothetical protein